MSQINIVAKKWQLDTDSFELVSPGMIFRSNNDIGRTALMLSNTSQVTVGSVVSLTSLTLPLLGDQGGNIPLEITDSAVRTLDATASGVYVGSVGTLRFQKVNNLVTVFFIPVIRNAPITLTSNGFLTLPIPIGFRPGANRVSYQILSFL